MTQQAIISIKGRVQGIFFRAEAKDMARKLGLTGWVRNEADGNVTACVQGPKDLLQKFIKWARQGPPGAKVERMDFHYVENPAETFQSFEIRH